MEKQSNQKFFITGTDTGSGKTYVTCQILDYLSSLNFKAQALKPLASGAIQKDGKEIWEDVAALRAHNYKPSMNISYKCFKPPIAPHIAAKQHSFDLKASDLINFCKRDEFSSFDYLLIEGAGGIAVPLNTKETWVDFVLAMQIPVILVVGIRLGCINHALLTDFYLNEHKIPCIGWIANCLDQEILEKDEIISTLAEKMQAPLLTILNYCGRIVDMSCF